MISEKTRMKIFLTRFIDTLNSLKSVDVSSKNAADRTFKALLSMGVSKYGDRFVEMLKSPAIDVIDGTQLRELFDSEDFQNVLRGDRGGRAVLAKAKLSKASTIAKENTAIYNKYKDQMSENPDDVDNPNQTYAVRTQMGDGPVIFVEGVKSPEGRREIRRWYAWMYKVNYFQVRECSFDYWAAHPETQTATADIWYQNDDLYKAELKDIDESYDERLPRRRATSRRRGMMDARDDRRFKKHRNFEVDFDETYIDDEDPDSWLD